MNIRERVKVHQESIVVEVGKLNDVMQKELHERLKRDGWYRNQDIIDNAPNVFGPGHVTYYRWVDIDKRSYG